MSEIHPASEAFEQLKQFCFRIGEGRLEPREDEIHGIHYILLYHPIVENEYLLVHSDGSGIYVREFTEGALTESFEDFPLVHSFFAFDSGSDIFPFVVDLHDEEVTYHYTFRSIFAEGPASIALSRKTVISVKLPMAQYKRFKFLFDEVNPMPWKERHNPGGKLSPPEFPELDG